MYLKLLRTMNNNFETELQKTIALFEIMQKNLDYKTEIKVYKAKDSLLNAEQEHQKKLNFAKVVLLYNFNFKHLGSYESIYNSLFTVYIKQNIEGIITKSIEKKNPEKHFSFESLKKMYKMLFDAQNSCN